MCFDIFNLLSDFSFSFGHPFEFDHIPGGGGAQWGQIEFFMQGHNILKSTFLGFNIIVLMKKVLKKLCFNMIQPIFDSYKDKSFKLKTQVIIYIKL